MVSTCLFNDRMSSHNCHFADNYLSRRTFLSRAAHGVGKVALASLLSPSLFSAALAAASKSPSTDKWTGVVNPLHYPAKAKRVIWLSMAGGPSHLETFDYKPRLAAMNGGPTELSLPFSLKVTASSIRSPPEARLASAYTLMIAPGRRRY